MKVTITNHGDPSTAMPFALASHFKYQGLPRHLAWDAFVKARALKPEIDAKDFYAIYDDAPAAPLNGQTEVDFHPTHIDALKNGMRCQITEDDQGVFKIVWEDGSTGSHPPSFPPSHDRYTKILGASL